MKKRPVVLKLGGELIESAALKAIGKVIARAAWKRPLIVVHGGGREIDLALAQVGIPKRQIDGLRVTDPDTLEIVVSVLAGSINTRFVAAVNGAGGKAVGLSGADAGVAPVKKAAPHKAASGLTVDLGMVGTPVSAPPSALLLTLCQAGFIPVIACISAAKDGKLFNVNADTLAGSLAGRMKAKRLVIAGTTAGVLDKRRQTIPRLNRAQIAKLVSSGTATVGMVAKLSACQAALKGGASSVVIVDGRNAARLAKAVALEKTSATTRVVN